MTVNRIYLICCMLLTCIVSQAQVDSTTRFLQGLSSKYIKTVDDKIDKYSHRISSKTAKTLTKLAHWEDKIHGLLQKASPETAERLFGAGKPTFNSLLQQLKKGESIADGYKAKYDEYRDKLTTNLKYLQEQKDKIDTKLVRPVKEAKQKVDALDEEVKNSEALEAFIKERKKQLIDESIKYIGKSKYLSKISRESWYYVETLRNYKEIFSDKGKAEETAMTILNKIPAFQKFVQQNSMLASLFRMPGAGADNTASLAGLQTRAQVSSLIQDRIAAGGPNAAAVVRQNLQDAQAKLNELKDKIMKAGGGNGDGDMPDFKPNEQKSKTFKQRLELGSNFQFSKSNSLLPTTADIGFSLGYKLNTKSIIGLGASYKMGLGSIQHISLTHQGIGLRSFVDWKWKKQFFISGGFEMNHNAAFDNIAQLRSFNAWQQSGLIGISKKVNVKTKLLKGTKVQLLYDMLARQHVPVSQPVLFRVGYEFKN